MSDQINIAQVLGPRGTVKIDPEEHEAERASRLRNEDKDAAVERFKNVVTFLVAIAGLAALVVLCVWFGLVDKEASPETRRQPAPCPRCPGRRR